MRKEVDKSQSKLKSIPLKNYMFFDSNSGKSQNFQSKSFVKPYDEMHRGQEDNENQQSSSSVIKDSSKLYKIHSS